MINTLSTRPTHFLAGVELVQQAEKDLKICSENWPYPTRYSLGRPIDEYYAEIWQDGMDWNNNYWIIESIRHNDPIISPLLLFHHCHEEAKFNRSDFENLLNAIMMLRRVKFWIKNSDRNWTDDEVWPFIKARHDYNVFEFRKISYGPHIMFSVVMNHASQPPVSFLINQDFLPEKIVNEYFVNS